MTTTIAATSCMPSGAAWQHRTGGVGVATGPAGVPVAVGAGVPVGVGVEVVVGVGVGHEQIRVSHGVSVNQGSYAVELIGSV